VRGIESRPAARLTGTAKAKAAAPRIPADLAKALRAHEHAHGHFMKFPPSVKRGILGWIDAAKRAPTREKRILETARLAEWNIQINNWRW
jgi:uncharacterized protein YdeI (YjbR/CyaY-like superfamily)